MIGDPRSTRRPRSAGRALYASAVAQGRAPGLYASLGAPDTVEGRFELLTLHVILLIDRLSPDGADQAPSRQVLFDAYVAGLEGALREMGVGDLAVGKRMTALVAAFYGRLAGYQSAFSLLPDRMQLEALVARTITTPGDRVDPAPMAAYVIACRDKLADCPTITLLGGRVPWPTA